MIVFNGWKETEEKDTNCQLLRLHAVHRRRRNKWVWSAGSMTVQGAAWNLWRKTC